MNRRSFVTACSLLAALATRATAQNPAATSVQDTVVGVVNEFFRAMTAHDSAAFNRVQMPDGIQYAVRVQGDSVRVGRGNLSESARQIAAIRDTYVERMWQPTVLVHGPIAVVWGPYDIHRNGQFVHCGVDAFTLIRTPTGWRIGTVTYTAEPTGCAPSPLGPLPRSSP